jgi:hypothetical protein
MTVVHVKWQRLKKKGKLGRNINEQIRRFHSLFYFSEELEFMGIS